MKRIILSALIVLGVAGAVIGATRAYFTDTAVVNDNTFTAGYLDFTLNGDMTETKSLDLNDMEPGVWYGPYEMKVYNQNTPLSTMDIKYEFWAEKESSDPGFYAKLNSRVDHGYCMTGGISPVTYTWSGWVDDMYFDSPSSAIGSGKLSPNISHCFELYFQLDETAGNSLQGAGAVVDIVVNATQYSNPGWTE